MVYLVVQKHYRDTERKKTQAVPQGITAEIKVSWNSLGRTDYTL
jgi:hypothetical protein